MKLLDKKEMKQRGCIHCTEMKRKKYKSCVENFNFCKYSQCPFHELDGYKDYRDYLDSEESKIPNLEKLLGL